MERFSKDNKLDGIPYHYGQQRYASKRPTDTCHYTWPSISNDVTKSYTSRNAIKLPPCIVKEEEHEEKYIRTTTVTVLSENVSTAVSCNKDAIKEDTINKNISNNDNVFCLVVTAEKNNQEHESDSDSDEDEIIDVVGITENNKINTEVQTENIVPTTPSTPINEICCCNTSCIENTPYYCPTENVMADRRLYSSSSAASPTIQYSRCRIKDNVSVVGYTDSTLWTTQVIDEGYSAASTHTLEESSSMSYTTTSTTSTEHCYDSGCCNKDSRVDRKRPITVLSHCKDDDKMDYSEGPSSPKLAFIVSDNIASSSYDTSKGILRQRHDKIERKSAFKTVTRLSSSEKIVSSTTTEPTNFENNEALMEYQVELRNVGEDEETIPYSKPNIKEEGDHFPTSTLSQNQVINIQLNQSPIYGTRGIEKYFKSIPMNNNKETTMVEAKGELLVSENLKPANKKLTAIVKPLPVSEVEFDDTTDNKDFSKQQHQYIPKLFQNDDNKNKERLFIKTDQRKDFVVKHGDKLFGGSRVEEMSTSGSFLSGDTEMEEDNKKEDFSQQHDICIKEEEVEGENDQQQQSSSPFPNKNKKSRNKEASKQYREKRKHAIKEVFQKQHELEERNNKLREQLKSMEQLTVNMQKTFAKKMDTKEKIKMEIMKLITRSVAGNDNASAADLRTEITVLQKIFQRVANENLTKGCVEEAIYEILGEVIKQ